MDRYTVNKQEGWIGKAATGYFYYTQTHHKDILHESQNR